MRAIMADNDVQGHFDALIQRFQSADWSELWDSLGLKVTDFEAVGLARASSDALIWQTCQSKDVIS